MSEGLKNPGNANLPIGVERDKRKGRTAMREDASPMVWHSRGYLPHFESSDTIQHVTFHLADSLPHSVLQKLEAELKALPFGKQESERRKRIDAWVDAGHGSCVLGEPRIAEIVQESLLKFDAQRYRLLAWVVMPNHVHVLFEPIRGWTVAKIVASWKKFAARRIHDELRKPANREIGVPRENQERKGEGIGPVWHREYWDRYIRDGKHFERAVEYIHMNPVKAGLAAAADSWRWSSASFSGTNRGIGVPGIPR